MLAGGGIDSSFEAWTGSGFAGWTTSGGSLTVAGPVQAGAGAAHAQAANTGTIVVSSKFWLVDVVEGVEYTLRAWVYDDDPSINGLEIELELTDSAGVRIGDAKTAPRCPAMPPRISDSAPARSPPPQAPPTCA